VLKYFSICFHVVLINAIGFAARSGVEKRDRKLFSESFYLRKARKDVVGLATN
jgi:hypothetical protein